MSPPLARAPKDGISIQGMRSGEGVRSWKADSSFACAPLRGGCTKKGKIKMSKQLFWGGVTPAST